MKSKHEASIETNKRLILRHAVTCLDELDKLSAAIRRCVDGGGGFPVYLKDVHQYTMSLILLASAFNALENAHHDAQRSKRRGR